ncbi:hypothetical protein Tco_0496487 [Tanacetum coccineum]
MLRFKTAELWFKMSMEDTMRIIREGHFRGTMQRIKVEARIAGGRSYTEMAIWLNPGKPKPIMCLHTVKESGTQASVEMSTNLKRPQDSDYTKDERWLMRTGSRNFVTDDVDDLAINVDNVFWSWSMRCIRLDLMKAPNTTDNVSDSKSLSEDRNLR